MTIEQMIARQQELLNAARSAGRNMTREEAAEFDSLQRSIDAARAAGAGIAHGGQSSTPAAPANNTPEGQRQQTPAAGEGGNGGQDPQNAQRAIEAERQRIRSIEDLCTEFGLEARSYIDNGSTEEQVRAAVLEHLRSQHSPVATGIQVTDTQEDKFRRAAADSLLMRSGMTLERPEDGARSLMGMSIRDLAIECLQRDGSSESNLNRRSSDELYTMMARGFYNPEASFPAILDQTIEKAYKEGYRDSIEVVEDPTINALCGGLGNVMPWFLIGDPGDTDFIEVDYLNGQEIPNIRRMEAPGQLGFIWDIYLDWGISVMDYRGAVKNPGIKVDTKLKLV